MKWGRVLEVGGACTLPNMEAESVTGHGRARKVQVLEKCLYLLLE